MVLLDDPGAGAVDDLETPLVGTLHDIGADAVGADDDGRAVIDVIERVDGLDAEPLEVGDDALVVDDLAQGMRRLAGGRGLLGLVDRLAHAVAEPGPLRDPDVLDGSHDPSIIARGAADTRSTERRQAVRPRWRRGHEGRDPAHDQVRGEGRGGLPVESRRQLVGEAERGADADRDATARVRQLLAARPARVRAGDADRHDRRTGPQRQDGHAVARRLEARRRGSACPRGTRTGRDPRRGSAWPVDRPRRRRSSGPRRGRRRGGR